LAPASDCGEVLVKMSSITKQYGPVTVLSDVDFDVRAGEVHVLAGENGAGKSTLIKVLAGAVTDFAGRLTVGGEEVRFQSPFEAASRGIAIVYQELSLVGPMSVADNICSVRPPTRFGFVDDRRQRREATKTLQKLGLNLDVRQSVEQFPIAVQQLIEIAKALSQNAKVIVMDEPTSALSGPEADKLFNVIRDLKSQGCGIVYISHKMDEIELLADRITVLRDGRYIGTACAADLPVPKLIQWMVGREMPARSQRAAVVAQQAPRLTLSDFSVYPPQRDGGTAVSNVSLVVQPGEIVGLGGVQGSGASELLLGLFGAFGKRTTGEVRLDAEQIEVASPRQAIDDGIALLTNDRKETGLVLCQSIIDNASLADLPNLSPGGWRRPAREYKVAADAAASLHIRAANLEMPVGQLSGGNQQKVAIAKWIQTKPRLFLLDEPTRGIDIGAKHEIYDLMNRLTSDGASILLITSEMSELLELSDRIYVFHRGRIAAELSRDQATPEAVLSAAMGGPTATGEAKAG
jgi:ABC-type sugar transport system ATPase subunit